MKTAKMTLVTTAGREAIKAKLDEVQKRTRVRTATIYTIESVLERVELHLGIPKCKLDGVTVQFTGAQKFPNAYTYTPESTHFSAVHNGKYWTITEIKRDTCPNNNRAIIIGLTDQAKQAVLESICVMPY